jgi:hypothetical protein
VRAKADKIKVIVVRLSIDQNQIRLDMTIAIIAPIPGEGMVVIAQR